MEKDVPQSNTEATSAIEPNVSTTNDQTFDGTKYEAQIKSADMSEDMREEAIEVAQEALSKYKIEKEIAAHIKRTFDERKGATWHCIVGRNFGSFVTHETKHFLYMYIGPQAVLLWKTQ